MIQLGVYGMTDWSWCFVCRNFMVITLLWIHICFPSIFWVAARYGKKGFIFKFIYQVGVNSVSNWTCKIKFKYFLWIYVLTKRVEIGIQSNYPEQLKDWQLSFYLWRNVPWFVTSFHQRQQRDLQNVLRYGILYLQFQNIKTIHFFFIFQKLKECFI